MGKLYDKDGKFLGWVQEANEGLQQSPRQVPLRLPSAKQKPVSSKSSERAHPVNWVKSIFGGGFRNPPREKWDQIIEKIHAVLREERHVFFDSCIEILSTLPDVDVVNCGMSARIELGITVYQLHLGRELIAAREYVRPADGQSFVSMLYADACRYESIPERDEVMRRYWPQEDGMEICRFYSDIVEFITEIESPAREVVLLSANTVMRLSVVSQLAVASAFGDVETVQKLKDAHAKAQQ